MSIRTHGPVETCLNQECRCCRCGEESVCTPSNDFYTRTKDPANGPLYCEPCLMADWGKAPKWKPELPN
jgi:hypothetical protein